MSFSSSLKAQGYASSIAALKSLVYSGTDISYGHDDIMCRAAFIGNLDVVQYFVTQNVPKSAINKAALSGAKGNYTCMMKYFDTLPLTEETRRQIVLESATHNNGDIAEIYVGRGIDKETINSAITIAFNDGHMDYIKQIREAALQYAKLNEPAERCTANTPADHELPQKRETLSEIFSRKAQEQALKNAHKSPTIKKEAQKPATLKNDTSQKSNKSSLNRTSEHIIKIAPNKFIFSPDQFKNGMIVDDNGRLTLVSPTAKEITLTPEIKSIRVGAFDKSLPELKVHLNNPKLLASFTIREDLGHICVIDDSMHNSHSQNVCCRDDHDEK
jgi:hypothetical protein